MEFPEKLEALFQELPLEDVRVRIVPADPHRLRYLVTVLSPSFAAMDDSERLDLVWGQVLDRLDDSDQRRIEFLHTETPEETVTSPD